MKIYIYIIYFPTSERLNPYYVGYTYNLEKRLLKEHLNNDSLVGNALNKYDKWIVKKLHTCKTYKEAKRIEIEEIRNFNCIAPNGYNLTAGGDGTNYWEGKHRSEEFCKNQSRKMQGNQNAKGKNLGNVNGQGNKGNIHTTEQNKNHSEFMKGNQNAKGHGAPKGRNNVSHRTDVKIKRLKTFIAKLEREMCEKIK